MKTRFWAAFVVLIGASSAGGQVMSLHPPTSVAPTSTRAGTPRTAMAPPLQVTGKPVARVNGVALLDRDLLREMYAIFPYATQHSGFPKDLEPEIRRGALQMIIFEELVYQEAKRRGMVIPPAQLAAIRREFRSRFTSQAEYREYLKTEANGSEAVVRERLRRGLLIETLLNQEVTGPAHITSAQVKAQYEKNIAQYKHGEILHIQSLSIMPPDRTRAVLNEAKQRAQDAARRAKQAKSYRDFGLLAEKMSDDDFHVNMGDHKPQPASALPPPIVQAAAKMKPGDVSDLIQLGDYYTIFRLQARIPAGTTPFEEVKPRLQKDMQKEKTEQLRSALNRKLRQKAKIEIL